MTDIENVIKADAVVLIKCIAKCRAENQRILDHDDNAVYQCPTCPFYRHGCKDSLMERASNTIESLLIEQAIKPIREHELILCPMCKNTLFEGQKFCHECGKCMEWEANEAE